MSMESLTSIARSESVTDLNGETRMLRTPNTPESEIVTSPPKPFGIGKYFFYITFFYYEIFHKLRQGFGRFNL